MSYFLAWLIWDPPKEIFIIPGINWPILWYSALFFLGFFVGFYILKSIFCRFFLNYPFLSLEEVNWSQFFHDIKHPKNDEAKKVIEELFRGNSELIQQKDKQKILSILNHYIRKGTEQFVLPYMKSYILPQQSATRLFLERIFASILSIHKKGVIITDKLVVYVVIATLVGARLGHILFYENFLFYLKHPIEIINFWEGGIRGLSSHGAAIAILCSLFILAWRLKNFSPPIRWLTLVDFLCIPTAFAGFCIRLGNFFNQEILGVPTKVFWAIIFAHPADGSIPEPRHPVQLYEAAFYLFMFIVLFILSYRSSFLVKRGKLTALFLIGVFTFRFFIEFLKMPQSTLLSSPILLMGQYLSIPFVLLGVFLWFYSKRS